MTDGHDLETFFARLAAQAGTAVLDAGEAAAVLDLTRVVAHEAERRYAPLTAYVLGLVLEPGMPPAEREQRAREVTDIVRRLTGTGGAAADDLPAGGRPA